MDRELYCYCRKISKRILIKNFEFVNFWCNYLRSTRCKVKHIPLKIFMSSEELMLLMKLSMCKCSQLDRRINEMANELKTKHVCKICSKEFENFARLDRHSLKHAAKMNLSCIFCDKKMNRNILLSHLRTHTGELETYCEACNKQYATKETMLAHKNSRLHKTNELLQEKIKNPNSKQKLIDYYLST